MADAPYSRLQIYAEWLYRLLALLVGLVVVATGLLAWRHRDSPLIRWSEVAALVLVVLQAGLGAWTVISGNAPLVVVAHLGTAHLLFGALVVNVMATVDRPWATSRSEFAG